MSIILQKSYRLISIAILMMLFLHLFNQDYNGLIQSRVFIDSQHFWDYIALFGDAGIPIFAFASGYGLYSNFYQGRQGYTSANGARHKKIYLQTVKDGHLP